MRIRFLRDEVYETEGPNKGPAFPAGFVLDQADVGKVLKRDVTPDFAAGFLNRWLRRNAAETVGDDVEPTGDEVKKAEGAKPKAVQQPLGTEARGRPTAGVDAPDATKAGEKQAKK